MLKLPVDAILFDLDGTLRHSVPSADDTQFRFANQLGANVPADLQILGARWAHYYWAQSYELIDDIAKYRDDGEFWTNYSYRYLMSLTVPEERAANLAPQLTALMDARYTPENYVYPDTPQLLQTLKLKGFTLGLVSNRSRPCQEECENLGLLKYFDFVYVAAEVDVWKPDPRIFDRALELAGCSPERVVYVGDNYYADIMGARKADLQPVLLDDKHVFPDAECTVINNLGELVEMVVE